MSLPLFIKFPIPPHKVIGPDEKIFLIGSCFTEHIGNFLVERAFDVMMNPYGILFNPVSIANALREIIAKRAYGLNDLIKTGDGRYVSIHHHGHYSGTDPHEVVSEINKSINEAHDFLKNCETCIFTLGSAWVYTLLSKDSIVANCHKIPAEHFKKSLLTVNQIFETLKGMREDLNMFNANCKLILTISPVKHLKDGVIENQQSKASLILAVKEILELNSLRDYYFPAYEIVVDELRDYRFYDKDLAHPNALAIEIVWQKFIQTYFNDKALLKLSEAENLLKGIRHKPLHALPAQNLYQQIEIFLKKFPKK